MLLPSSADETKSDPDGPPGRGRVRLAGGLGSPEPVPRGRSGTV